MEIAGRRAVVTGAGIGTGRAIALALAEAGADVVASDIDEEGGKRTAVECGSRARFVRADLLVAGDVGRLIDSAEPAILATTQAVVVTSRRTSRRLLRRSGERRSI